MNPYQGIWAQLGATGAAGLGVGLPASEPAVQASQGRQPGILSPSHPFGAAMLLGLLSGVGLVVLYFTLPD